MQLSEKQGTGRDKIHKTLGDIIFTNHGLSMIPRFSAIKKQNIDVFLFI